MSGRWQVGALAGLSVACSPGSASPPQAPACVASAASPGPSPSPPATPRAAASAEPACRERFALSPELAATPQILVGESIVFATPCGAPDVSRAREREADCAEPHRNRFPTCDPATTRSAISPATLLRSTVPPGARLKVRGRLGPAGARGSRSGPSLHLVSGREYDGMCVAALLRPPPGTKPAFWRCSKAKSEESELHCCNESGSRPRTGTDLVVEARMLGQTVDLAADGHGDTGLEVESFCVVGNPR